MRKVARDMTAVEVYMYMYSGYSGYKQVVMAGELRRRLKLGLLAEVKHEVAQLKQRRNNKSSYIC